MQVVVNCGSGTVTSESIAALHSNGAQIDVVEARSGDELKGSLRDVAERNNAVGIAGGDGSVSCAAQIASEYARPLAVVPLGTLNHFARDIGLESLDDALHAIEGGTTRSVDLGEFSTEHDGRHIFINNICIGLYPQFVRCREQHQEQWGKKLASIVAAVRVLANPRSIDVTINGEHLKVWLLFVGNCKYGEEGLNPGTRADMQDGVLDVRIVRAKRRFRVKHLARAIWRSARRDRYIQFDAQYVEVRARKRTMLVASDGELLDVEGSFSVTKHRSPLTVFAPTN